MRDPRPWTSGEDEILQQALLHQPADNISWLEVAAQLKGLSNKDCRKRWTYSLCPKIAKGAWSEWEDAALREGVEQYGTQWARVSRSVGTRQPDQCSRRWHEAMKPNINRDRWSLADDVNLKNAVKAHGRRWTEIVERYLPDRTPIATRNRYNQCLRRDQRRPERELYHPDDRGLMNNEQVCLPVAGSLYGPCPVE
ncbi:MAG: hypothetical protein Q9181_002524 [Wetmoreana brouardii]